jgi:arginase family enzyme
MSAKAGSDETAFSGLLHAGTGGTFMRLPFVPPKTDILEANNVSAAFVGFPWDSMCISRTGTNYGPRAVREASDQFTFFNANRNVDLRQSYSFADCGDVPVIPGSAVATMARAETIISTILSAGAMPITVGGDHSITIAGVRAFRKTYHNPGLILVDSHLDTADDVGGEPLNHACPIARAVDSGFDPTKIVIVGYNGNGTDSVYLTFDIDAIDGAYAPGTGVPAPGGLTSREAIALVSELSKVGLGAMDIVEVSPPYDHDGITSRLAMQIILEALSGSASKAS